MPWENEQKPSQDTSFLLKEDGDFLLQETGDKLVISYGAGAWTNESKNLI